MRFIHMWNITAQVRANIAAGHSSVEIGSFYDPRVLTAITVSKGHNYLEPGHYVVIDVAEHGEPEYVSLRLAPALTFYRDNPTVKANLIGIVMGDNDGVPCLVFHLTGADSGFRQPTWAEQDASNS